jgi:TusA-related sulfurtransferase
MNSIACDLYVDISGSDCATPISKLSDALEALLSGQTLMVVSKKQALMCDVPAFCQQQGLQLADQGEIDGMFYFLIQTRSA